MLKKFTVAVPAAAIAVAMAIGVATPAVADPANSTDQQFLQAVKTKGVHIADSTALRLAKSTCLVLQQGGSIEDALAHIKSGSNLSDKDAMTFGSYAVYSYCRQYLPKGN